MSKSGANVESMIPLKYLRSGGDEKAEPSPLIADQAGTDEFQWEIGQLNCEVELRQHATRCHDQENSMEKVSNEQTMILI